MNNLDLEAIKQSPRQASVEEVADMVDEIERLRARVEELEEQALDAELQAEADELWRYAVND